MGFVAITRGRNLCHKEQNVEYDTLWTREVSVSRDAEYNSQTLAITGHMICSICDTYVQLQMKSTEVQNPRRRKDLH